MVIDMDDKKQISDLEALAEIALSADLIDYNKLERIFELFMKSCIEFMDILKSIDNLD